MCVSVVSTRKFRPGLAQNKQTELVYNWDKKKEQFAKCQSEFSVYLWGCLVDEMLNFS